MAADNKVITLRQVESLEKVYNQILGLVSPKKGINVGNALVTFPNKERTVCELSTTYITKPRRFSKEQRVIVTLTFNKVDDGAYVANVADSVFHIVSEEKGGLKEIWSGTFKEAAERISDIVELYTEGIDHLINKLSNPL